MQNFSAAPLYLFSDLDGTLGIEGQGIPAQNRLALQQFVHRGGKFGICTGRSPASASQFLGDIPLSLPSVVNGGCALFDFATQQSWDERFLPASALDFAYRMLRKFPRAALVAVNRDGYFQIDLGDRIGRYPFSPPEKLRKPWYRLILVDLPADTAQIAQYLLRQVPPQLRIERTAPDFVEIMPAQAGKWPAMQRLCTQMGIPLEKVVFLGDFYNDIELLEHVGVGACVGDAPIAVQNASSLLLPYCMQGIVEPLFQRLKEKTAAQCLA